MQVRKFTPERVVTLNKSKRSNSPFIKASNSVGNSSQSPPRVLVTQWIDQMAVTQKAVETALKV